MYIYNLIKSKIEKELAPTKLEIIDESHKHQGHSGHHGGGETHFRMIIVANKFIGLSKIERQKLVHQILKDELKEKIHALSFKALTEQEL